MDFKASLDKSCDKHQDKAAYQSLTLCRPYCTASADASMARDFNVA